MPRGRWIFLTVATVVILAAVVAAVWYYDATRTPDRFDEVRAGMTKQEVESVVGPSTVHISGRSKRTGEARSGWAWHSPRQQMIVWFADDGSALEVEIKLREKPRLQDRIRHRLGL
jgi:hypothetical protein